MMDDVLICNSLRLATGVPPTPKKLSRHVFWEGVAPFQKNSALMARWAAFSELGAALVSFSEDIIQAVQALEESKPEPTGELEIALADLRPSLKELPTYCNDVRLEPLAYPFSRSEMQVWDALCCLLPPAIGDKIYAATKWCVSGPVGHPITTEWVLAQVKERCRRPSGRVELLQFYRCDYEANECPDVPAELVGVARTRPELVPVARARDRDVQFRRGARATEHLAHPPVLARGLKAVLENVRRTEQIWIEACGGFLAEKLASSTRPDDIRGVGKSHALAAKAYKMVLLAVLSTGRAKTWASVWPTWLRAGVLQQPAVGAVIVRTRLGVASHGDVNGKVFEFKFDDSDLAAINAARWDEPRED
ncbi:hypothetical protein DL769_009945 [Monosporascus sp. CRB-8-3]|nr:hypothetical protein DL769_009945 [Monosporascus sp. CRB-8-3]